MVTEDDIQTIPTAVVKPKRAPAKRKPKATAPEPEPQLDGVEQIQKMFEDAESSSEQCGCGCDCCAKDETVEPTIYKDSIVAPGYWQGFEGKYGRVNVLAFLGFIMTFLFFPLGILFSGLGLLNARAVPDDIVGRVLGWFGVVASLLITMLMVFLITFMVAYGRSF